jgi:SAM-dependent methyltransferase
MAPNSSGEFLQRSRDRLYPSLANPNFLVLQARRVIFARWIKELSPSQGLTVLDVGGRYQPYRPLFENRLAQYIACDLAPTELVDIIASGESLPFPSHSFDVVLCTQVFEYFDHPHLAAKEIHRVLRPGGVLLMSVVSFGPRFVDDEHWRYTPSGIQAVLRLFGQITIVPETSSVGGLLRATNLALHALAHFGPLRRVYELTVCPLINLIGLGFEKLRISGNDQFTPNYSVLATKQAKER